jgi:hypothetical protein
MLSELYTDGIGEVVTESSVALGDAICSTTV